MDGFTDPTVLFSMGTTVMVPLSDLTQEKAQLKSYDDRPAYRQTWPMHRLKNASDLPSVLMHNAHVLNTQVTSLGLDSVVIHTLRRAYQVLIEEGYLKPEEVAANLTTMIPNAGTRREDGCKLYGVTWPNRPAAIQNLVWAKDLKSAREIVFDLRRFDYMLPRAIAIFLPVTGKWQRLAPNYSNVKPSSSSPGTAGAGASSSSSSSYSSSSGSGVRGLLTP